MGWDDLRPGDEMWYLIARKGRVNPDEPHGPFTVVDPARGRIRNTSGVEMEFRPRNFGAFELILLLPKNAVRPPCRESLARSSASLSPRTESPAPG